MDEVLLDVLRIRRYQAVPVLRDYREDSDPLLQVERIIVSILSYRTGSKTTLE